jgi:hypothetical protein
MISFNMTGLIESDGVKDDIGGGTDGASAALAAKCLFERT